jgi:hypothetical protein
MLRGLYGLIADRGGTWVELSGSGFLRARLYRAVAVFVAVSLDEQGTYQVVEQQGPDSRPVVVLRGKLLGSSGPGPAGWPAESIRRQAGLPTEPK